MSNNIRAADRPDPAVGEVTTHEAVRAESEPDATVGFGAPGQGNILLEHGRVTPGTRILIPHLEIVS